MSWRIASRSLFSIACLFVSAAAGPTVAAKEPAYTPSTKDMLSINATLHRYLMGLDHRDRKMLASAFTEDATWKLIDHGEPGPVTHGRANIENARSTGPRPVQGGVPPAMFHMISNDAWDYESPTRVKHFAYWLNVIPGAGQTTTLGASGHYEDVFVKRNGEWLIYERTIFVGTK